MNCACIVSGNEPVVSKAYFGDDAMDELCDFILFGEESLLSTGKFVKIFAHNGGRFDWQLFLRAYFKRARKKPSIIWDGSTIKQIRIGNIFFLDSRMYIKAPLRAFPKMFGTTGFQKGYFPHEFNITENEDYVGRIPKKKYFDPKDVKKDDFKEWYRSWRGRRDWCLMEQLASYCLDDCYVLREGYEKFSTEFKDKTAIKPGTGNCTTAGAANQVWRANFLPNQTVGVINEQGYSDCQSRKALRFLHWKNNKEYEGELQFSGVQGEKKIKIRRQTPLPKMGGVNTFHTVASKQKRKMHPAFETKYETFKLDGFHEESNTAVEFYGCVFHGCPECFDPSTVSPFFENKKMSDLYAETMEREAKLREYGLELDVMWECEWDQLCENDPALDDELEGLGLNRKEFQLENCTPRDCLFGGRTENTCLYYQAKEGEKIMYFDVTSLYPTVNKYDEYPIKHPRIIRCNFDYDLNAYFGMIRAKVLPPKNLLHPVLPVKANMGVDGEKLVFALCRTCVEEQNFVINSCNHDDEERSFEGAWISPEFYKAIEKGYEIVEFYEVWHYPLRRKGLYAKYVDLWFAMKAEAKGWPKKDMTDAEKQKYLDDFKKENDGVELNPDKIEENKTLYMIAKLLLNSLWGGWCKNPTKKKQKKIIMKAQEFHQWLNDDSIWDKNFQLVDEKCMLLSPAIKDEFKSHDGKGNILHGAFTTGWARLRLYKALELLGERVLYFDTHSVIFVLRKGETNPLPQGGSLGMWTNEVDPQSKVEDGPEFPCFISEFVSSGHKNYAFKVCYLNADGSRPKNCDLEVARHKCVVRGFTLDKNDKNVNFDAILRIVHNSKIWGDADDELFEELIELYEEEEKKVTRSKSGIVNIDPPKTSKFTIKIGDGRSIAGLKRKRVVLEDGSESYEIVKKSLKTTFEEKLALKPGMLKRSYTCTITKRCVNWDTLFLLPFGYVEQ